MTDTPTIQAWRAREVLGLEDFTDADLEAIRAAEPPGGSRGRIGDASGAPDRP